MGSGHVRWCLSVQQGHLAEQVEVRPDVHEALGYLILQFLPSTAFDGLHVPGPAVGADLGVQRGGTGDALVPPLVQVRLVRIQDRGPAEGSWQRAKTSFDY